MERARSASLFKFRAAAKAVIAMKKMESFLIKDKITWGPATSPYDAISGMITSARSLNSVSYPNVPLPVPMHRADTREIFYTHPVTAGKDLCICCFDALLVYLGAKRKVDKRVNEVKEREREREEELIRGDVVETEEEEEEEEHDALEDASLSDPQTPIPDQTELLEHVVEKVNIPKKYVHTS